MKTALAAIIIFVLSTAIFSVILCLIFLTALLIASFVMWVSPFTVPLSWGMLRLLLMCAAIVAVAYTSSEHGLKSIAALKADWAKK